MSKPKRVKTETVWTTWEVWTYDVWGNARDGYEVNDRSCINRALVLDIPIEHCNVGEPTEFASAFPTDRQLRETFGVRYRIATDGDDTHIQVDRDRDSYPIGEMTCTSHESLSPIRANGEPEETPVS